MTEHCLIKLPLPSQREVLKQTYDESRISDLSPLGPTIHSPH